MTTKLMCIGHLQSVSKKIWVKPCGKFNLELIFKKDYIEELLVDIFHVQMDNNCISLQGTKLKTLNSIHRSYM